MNTFYLAGEVLNCNKEERFLNNDTYIELYTTGITDDKPRTARVYLADGLFEKIDKEIVFNDLKGSFCAVKGYIESIEGNTKVIAEKITILDKDLLNKNIFDKEE